jgi:hypothetical protein
MPQPPTLGAVEVAALAQASPTEIERAARRLARYLGNGRWLGTNNRYARRTVATINSDTNAPQDAIPKHLAEYIAASAVLHSVDGWSYLGRALNALCHGDGGTSRHLAYYAELRAALSLLATQGIGVFSRRHVTIDAAGRATFFRGQGTHVMTWLALEHWTDSQTAVDLLSRIIRPRRQTLRDWVDGLGPRAGAWSPIGREWLRAWGLDLRFFARDRDIRNEASYRPNMLQPGAAADPTADAEFVQGFWRLLEPTPSDQFRQLDRQILRLTLERAFRSATRREPVGDPEFRSQVEATLDANADEPVGSLLGRFLLRTDEPSDAALLDAARQRASHLDTRYHVYVIARAALLLRVATGAVLETFSSAQVPVSDHRFWSERLADERGLSFPGAFPPDGTDLWADVSDALDRFETLVAAGSFGSFFALQTSAAQEIGVLTGSERIAIWSLAA